MNQQGTFTFQDSPLARRTDPDTSQEAGREQLQHLRSDYAFLIKVALRCFGPANDFTAKQLARKARQEGGAAEEETYRKRIPEVAEIGFFKKTDKARCPLSGKRATRFRVKEI